MKLTRLVLLLGVAAVWPAAAQSLDVSGNGLLNGTFYFRHVAYYLADGNGNLQDAIAVYGSITFDGKGSYTTTGTFVDAAAGSGSQFSAVTGTYSISASGFGFINFPEPVFQTSEPIYGLVSHGVFIGSGTENKNNFNDLFIAAPLASPAPTSASFSGSYSMFYFNMPSNGDVTQAFDAQFLLNPDGRGNVGTVNGTAYLGSTGSTVYNISQTGVRYIFSNGAANVTFPTTQNSAIIGSEFLYFSPDGNFVFGGASNPLTSGFDMMIGVKLGSGATNFSGLYYQAGLDQDESGLASGFVTPDSYYGSLYADSKGGHILAHQRIVSPTGPGSYDYTVSDPFSLNSDGTLDDTIGFHYVFGSGGAYRVGFGKGPLLALNVAVQAPPFTGTGVYLNPTGVQNAAEPALFTAGIAPGEFILLNGTGLAATVASSSAFPTTLGGVQVMINGTAAPLYVVSPTLIEALVPYGIASNAIASIQVISNGSASNIVTVLTSLTAPGVFTVPPGGIGYAAAQHADYSLITPSHPAQIGETIIIYGTGLGLVNPAVGDGGVGPSSSLANATNKILVSIDGQAATVGFAGLTPTAIGLYQINVVVPSGVRSGDVYLDVSGPDFYTSQAQLSVGAGGAVARPHVRSAASRRPGAVRQFHARRPEGPARF